MKNHPDFSPVKKTLKCEFGSLGEVQGRVILWWLLVWCLGSRLLQIRILTMLSGTVTSIPHNVLFFCLAFSCSRLTALFSHELQSRGASAWEKLMVVCASHYLRSLAALRCCVEILRCSIRLYSSHYASLSSNFCDQIRETISFGNIFELWYVYMEKTISV